VLGSAAVFDDEWLGKEDNTALLDFLLGWMLRDPACALSRRNLAEPEILDPRPVTHVAELAAQPRVCLQASVGCGVLRAAAW
jgi:intraflagellar transport protein 52